MDGRNSFETVWHRGGAANQNKLENNVVTGHVASPPPPIQHLPSIHMQVSVRARDPVRQNIPRYGVTVTVEHV